jgi:hypothetical protein
MSIYQTKPQKLDGVRTYSLAKRKSKVTVKDFAKTLGHTVLGRRPIVRALVDSLPRILAGDDFRAVIAAIETARRKKRTILWGIGGHVIKVGLAPVLIDLLGRGYISGIAMNGAALIHDFEIAVVGNTSEDVEAVLKRGEFGMAEETGLYLNEAAVGAARSGIGLGEAAGKLLTNKRLGAKHLDVSILAAAYRARIPVTVHLAIGTDIPHMHRSADGAALGAASHYDFRLFCALVRQMHPGGVYLNWGSAVILPEVFLKAVSVAQNLLGASGRGPGASGQGGLRGITTASFDFLKHYRPAQNVVKRPTTGRGSHGYSITGHHEIMLPLLAAALRL